MTDADVTAVTPAVSVVMATYNRGHIIGHAIESVRAGTFADWELIVVGDACTDDTARVVAAFADARIRFVNLGQNFGEQTGPNNVGVGLARGRYLAFLNHDDLWLPDHLERSVALLEREPVDLVFGLGLIAQEQPPHRLTGATCQTPQAYEPWMEVPASLWVMRRDLSEANGPWRPSWELRAPPSNDWLYRAHRRGARLRADPRLCAVLIQSGTRANSYVTRGTAEHERWSACVRDPRALRRELEGVAAGLWMERQVRPWHLLTRLGASLWRVGLWRAGVWPAAPRYWMKYWRKGALLRALRRHRGLPARGPAATQADSGKVETS